MKFIMTGTALLFVISVTLCLPMRTSASAAETNNVTVSWDHVTVWFDHTVRYYDHEAENAYSKEDLAVMIDVVSTRFNKIVIGSAPVEDQLPPGKEANSRIWIPSVVAEHNKRKHDSTSKPMEVIVTYDVAKISRTEQVTSFDVAKYMADSSNDVYPGTVKTLMMYTGFSVFSSFYNAKELVQQLKIAREKMNLNTSLADHSKGASGVRNYSLAVFMDLKDCGHFRGSLGEKAKEILPHVDIIAILLRPNYHSMAFNAEVTHKMFITKFEDCERKLKEEKAGIQVMPAVLWMSRSKKGAISSMARGWQLMSNWARKEDKNIIMYEAFDTPNGHLISDQGWWKLKDRSEHVISMDAFVEKIQEIGSSSGKSESSPYSTEDNYDEDGDNLSGNASSKKKLLRSSAYPSSFETPSAVYVVLILLSVICILLVAVIVGLVYGFNKIVLKKNNNSILGQGHHTVASRSRQLQSQGFGEENGSINGSVLEIRDTDTAPIVTVSYKK